MAFEKGKPKTGGRKKNVVNKTTAQVKESLQWVMERLETTLVDDIANVNSSRRLQLYTDLMNYVKPKLSATKVDGEISTKLEGKVVIIFRDTDSD